MQRSFRSRTFTTFIIAWTFAALILSGAVLYICPPGRIANWTNWMLLGITKSGWQGIHVMTAIVFLIAGCFHLLRFNWKVFSHYLKKERRGRNNQREMFASFALVCVIILGSILSVPPFSTVMTAGEAIREAWQSPSNEAPVPHTELKSLAEVSTQLGIDTEKAKAKLEELGWATDDDRASLKQIARRNSIAPQDVYQALRGISPQRRQGMMLHPLADTGGLTRLGSRNLAEVVEALDLRMDTVIAILSARGVDADPQKRIREIAAQLNMNPPDLLNLLRSGDM